MADIRAAAATADIADRPATVGRVPLRVMAAGVRQAVVDMRRAVVAVTPAAGVVDIPAGAAAVTPEAAGTARV